MRKLNNTEAVRERAHDNLTRARWWVALDRIAESVNNELLPVACRYGLGDAAWHEALRQAAQEIARFQGICELSVRARQEEREEEREEERAGQPGEAV